MKTIKSRLDDLETKKTISEKPAWVIVKDGEEPPEGVKAYSPEANPDLWDEPMAADPAGFTNPQEAF